MECICIFVFYVIYLSHVTIVSWKSDDAKNVVVTLEVYTETLENIIRRIHNQLAVTIKIFGDITPFSKLVMMCFR